MAAKAECFPTYMQLVSPAFSSHTGSSGSSASLTTLVCFINGDKIAQRTLERTANGDKFCVCADQSNRKPKGERVLWIPDQKKKNA